MFSAYSVLMSTTVCSESRPQRKASSWKRDPQRYSDKLQPKSARMRHPLTAACHVVGGMRVRDEQVLVWSESDMKAALYNFRIKPEWLTYQAIGRPVPCSLACIRVLHRASRGERNLPSNGSRGDGMANCPRSPPPSPTKWTLSSTSLRRSTLTEKSGAMHCCQAAWTLRGDLSPECTLMASLMASGGVQEAYILGCRKAEKLGRHLLPRRAVSELSSLTAWLAEPSSWSHAARLSLPPPPPSPASLPAMHPKEDWTRVARQL